MLLLGAGQSGRGRSGSIEVEVRVRRRSDHVRYRRRSVNNKQRYYLGGLCRAATKQRNAAQATVPGGP